MDRKNVLMDQNSKTAPIIQGRLIYASRNQTDTRQHVTLPCSIIKPPVTILSNVNQVSSQNTIKTIIVRKDASLTKLHLATQSAIQPHMMFNSHTSPPLHKDNLPKQVSFNIAPTYVPEKPCVRPENIASRRKNLGDTPTSGTPKKGTKKMSTSKKKSIAPKTDSSKKNSPVSVSSAGPSAENPLKQKSLTVLRKNLMVLDEDSKKNMSATSSVANYLENDTLEKGIEVLDSLDDTTLQLLVVKVMDVINKLHGDYLEEELTKHLGAKKYREIASQGTTTFREFSARRHAMVPKEELEAVTRATNSNSFVRLEFGRNEEASKPSPVGYKRSSSDPLVTIQNNQILNVGPMKCSPIVKPDKVNPFKSDGITEDSFTFNESGRCQIVPEVIFERPEEITGLNESRAPKALLQVDRTVRNGKQDDHLVLWKSEIAGEQETAYPTSATTLKTPRKSSNSRKCPDPKEDDSRFDPLLSKSNMVMSSPEMLSSSTTSESRSSSGSVRKFDGFLSPMIKSPYQDGDIFNLMIKSPLKDGCSSPISPAANPRKLVVRFKDEVKSPQTPKVKVEEIERLDISKNEKNPPTDVIEEAQQVSVVTDSEIRHIIEETIREADSNEQSMVEVETNIGSVEEIEESIIYEENDDTGEKQSEIDVTILEDDNETKHILGTENLEKINPDEVKKETEETALQPHTEEVTTDSEIKDETVHIKDETVHINEIKIVNEEEQQHQELAQEDAKEKLQMVVEIQGDTLEIKANHVNELIEEKLTQDVIKTVKCEELTPKEEDLSEKNNTQHDTTTVVEEKSQTNSESGDRDSSDLEKSMNELAQLLVSFQESSSLKSATSSFESGISNESFESFARKTPIKIDHDVDECVIIETDSSSKGSAKNKSPGLEESVNDLAALLREFQETPKAKLGERCTLLAPELKQDDDSVPKLKVTIPTIYSRPEPLKKDAKVPVIEAEAKLAVGAIAKKIQSEDDDCVFVSETVAITDTPLGRSSFDKNVLKENHGRRTSKLHLQHYRNRLRKKVSFASRIIRRRVRSVRRTCKHFETLVNLINFSLRGTSVDNMILKQKVAYLDTILGLVNKSFVTFKAKHVLQLKVALRKLAWGGKGLFSRDFRRKRTVRKDDLKTAPEINKTSEVEVKVQEEVLEANSEPRGQYEEDVTIKAMKTYGKTKKQVANIKFTSEHPTDGKSTPVAFRYPDKSELFEEITAGNEFSGDDPSQTNTSTGSGIVQCIIYPKQIKKEPLETPFGASICSTDLEPNLPDLSVFLGTNPPNPELDIVKQEHPVSMDQRKIAVPSKRGQKKKKSEKKTSQANKPKPELPIVKEEFRNPVAAKKIADSLRRGQKRKREDEKSAKQKDPTPLNKPYNLRNDVVAIITPAAPPPKNKKNTKAHLVTRTYSLRSRASL